MEARMFEPTIPDRQNVSRPSTVRRNGYEAACEPCRRSKQRCGHEKPYCLRCRAKDKRKGVNRCWYHPAPLTKGRSGEATATPFNESERAPPSPPQTTGREDVSTSPAQSLRTPAASTGQTPRFHTWPGVTDETNGNDVEPPTIVNKIHEQQMATVNEILGGLRYISEIESHVREHCRLSQVCLMPSTLVMQLMVSVKIAYWSLNTAPHALEDGHVMAQIAEDVLRSTKANFDVSPNIDYKEFACLVSGANLRVETLGILFSIAARSAIYTAGGTDWDDAFMQCMIGCSDLCLTLGRDVSSRMNDMLSTLAWENMQLLSLLDGDSSLSVWRRLGNVATDLYALGLHREATYSSTLIPPFLEQWRRRVYTSLYHTDKTYAAFFNRPPRFPKRYADTGPPLDLDDQSLIAHTDAEIEKTRKHLTPDGWNADGKLQCATWLRLRRILAEMREELVEYNLACAQTPDNAWLRSLLERCQVTWNSLPRHVRYDQDVFDTRNPTGTRVMLRKVYLSYLHLQFQIMRLLDSSGSNRDESLLQTCSSMLEVCMQIATAGDRDAHTPRDLSTTILGYGLPCAMVLVMAFQDSTRDASWSFPPSLKRSVLIRRLSAFVSYLETVCRPFQANYISCMQAARTMSRILDEVLDSLTGAPIASSTQQATSGAANDASPTEAQQPTVTGVDVAVPDMMDFGDLGDLDLVDWANNIDWTATSNEWNFF